MNVTRWSSCFHMVKQYFFLKDHFGIISNEKKQIIPFLLTPLENEKLSDLFSILEEVNTMTLMLQQESPSVTLSSVRYGFDILFKKITFMKINFWKHYWQK